jgi:hypothetical protein
MPPAGVVIDDTQLFNERLYPRWVMKISPGLL